MKYWEPPGEIGKFKSWLNLILVVELPCKCKIKSIFLLSYEHELVSAFDIIPPPPAHKFSPTVVRSERVRTFFFKYSRYAAMCIKTHLVNLTWCWSDGFYPAYLGNNTSRK